MQGNSRKYEKISKKVSVSNIFMGELNNLILKLSYFLEICVRKVLSLKFGSEEGLNVFSTIIE